MSRSTSLRQAQSISELELYERVFANSQESIFLIHPERGTIEFANAKAIEDTNYELAELEGKRFSELFLPEDQGAIEMLLKTAVQWKSGVDSNRKLRRKGGKKIILELNAILSVIDGEKRVFCSCRDVTARVRAEERNREYQSELEASNARLEARVVERTQELERANLELNRAHRATIEQKRELEDVMNTIQEGIFTVSPSLAINAEHSRFVGEIFRDKLVAGAEIGSFLYGAEDEEKRETIREWLKFIFLKPGNFSLVGEFAPRELRYARVSADGKREHRDLRLQWLPIVEGGAVAKVMVVCLDVTEERRLAAEISRKEAEHRDELELIAQLISTPREVVGHFIEDLRRALRDASASVSDDRVPARGEITSFLRALHTLKGHARQAKLRSIELRAHELEPRATALARMSDAAPEAPEVREAYESIRASFRALEKSLNELCSFYVRVTGSESGAPVGRSASDDPSLSALEAVQLMASGPGVDVDVPLRKIEILLDTVLSTERNAVPVTAVRRAISWLMETPMRTLFERLESCAYSVAADLGRPVRITRSGDELSVDFRSINLLNDALIHAVRNSLDHGAETPEERARSGKAGVMTLEFSARHGEDDDILIEIRDDGRGIDPVVVRSRAIERGLATQEALEQCTPEQVLQILFAPGFSTRKAATELSGRGIGLDVVKQTVEAGLSGEVMIDSTLGQGTLLKIRLPRRALSRLPQTFYAASSAPEERGIWEWSFGTSFKELVPGSEVPNSGAVVADVSGIQWLDRTRGGSQRIVCYDALEPKEIVHQLMVKQGVRHFVDRRHPGAIGYMRSALRKISTRPSWGLSSHFWPATPIHTHLIRDYSKKSEMVDLIEGFASKLKSFSSFPSVFASIADEMLMNAMFDAPRGLDGSEKYNSLSRKHRLILEHEEAVRISYGADPNFAGISIRDPFGSLDWETVVRSLQRCYADGGATVNQSEGGGAGLGLYIIFDAAHRMIVNSAPGRETEVIALVALTRSFEEYQRAGKCFGFFTEE